MAFLDELIDVLKTAGVVTNNVFASTKAQIPTGAGPYLSIVETGGLVSERVHDEPANQGYDRPTAQIVARAERYDVARTLARNAYQTLRNVRNREILGTWYLWIREMQPPFDLGLDENGRARVAFNVMCMKRPS